MRVPSQRDTYYARDQLQPQRPFAHGGDDDRAERALRILTTALEALLALRFAMRLLGAGDFLPHVSLVYAITAPIVAPFRDLVHDWDAGPVQFEPGTLLAMTAAGLVGWAACIVAGLVSAPRR